MNIVILSKSDKAIYGQIYEQLASQILNGELGANYCLPSIRTVAKELNISIITIKKAWEMLERDELIYTRAGKGCFVAEHIKKNLDDKRFALAVEKIRKDVPYYKNLNISLDELVELLKKEY
jgi:GntR family transcriptional regulator